MAEMRPSSSTYTTAELDQMERVLDLVLALLARAFAQAGEQAGRASAV
jgi:hypothetical protein